jgi:nitroreductase
MDFFEAVHRRRSVRKYTSQPVPRPVLEQIVQAGIEAPSGCNEQLRHYIIVDDPAVVAKMHAVSPAMTGSVAAIVLLVEPKPTPYGEFWVQDASAAMENMLLAAVALGYDGCWVEGAVRRHEPMLRELLGVPEDLRVWSLTPIGEAAAAGKRPDKPGLAERTHYNQYKKA